MGHKARPVLCDWLPMGEDTQSSAAAKQGICVVLGSYSSEPLGDSQNVLSALLAHLCQSDNIPEFWQLFKIWRRWDDLPKPNPFIKVKNMLVLISPKRRITCATLRLLELISCSYRLDKLLYCSTIVYATWSKTHSVWLTADGRTYPEFSCSQTGNQGSSVVKETLLGITLMSFPPQWNKLCEEWLCSKVLTAL